jgi:hypothetical protein
MTDDLLTATMTLADHELDDPAVHAAARAVIDDLASIPPSLAPPRHRARRAVAVAAACLVTAGAAAAYAVASGAGAPATDPAAVTGTTVETLPDHAGDIGSLCDAVRTWLAPPPDTDIEKAIRLAHIHEQLALYEHVAELADQPQEAARAESLQSAMDAGDRTTIEEFVAQSCPA